MVLKWNITIPQLTGDRERTAFIYLPVGYGKNNCRYPVMYMFDGQNLFSDEDATYGRSWGLAAYLDYTETPLIVVGVECNTEGNGRLSEYSPINFTTPFGEKITGHGKKYMEWLVNEFKPYIDEHFATLPDRENTAIGGSSLGGLMTLYAMSNYGKFFSKGAALSPSIWVDSVSALPIFKAAKFQKDTIIYMDYGSLEFDEVTPQKQLFADMCAVLIEKDVLLTSRIVPNGTHCEASWEKQIPFFMNTLNFLPKN